VLAIWVEALQELNLISAVRRGWATNGSESATSPWVANPP